MADGNARRLLHQAAKLAGMAAYGLNRKRKQNRNSDERLAI